MSLNPVDSARAAQNPAIASRQIAADESSQNVTFNVSSTNGGLFAVPPAIAPDGTLTYTPNLIALGSSTVTVRLRDDGGNANGGSDTSADQTFTITIVL